MTTILNNEAPFSRNTSYVASNRKTDNLGRHNMGFIFTYPISSMKCLIRLDFYREQLLEYSRLMRVKCLQVFAIE